MSAFDLNKAFNDKLPILNDQTYKSKFIQLFQFIYNLSNIFLLKSCGNEYSMYEDIMTGKKLSFN